MRLPGKALLTSLTPASLLLSASAWAGPAADKSPSEAIFVAGIVLLLVAGRLTGELMQRIGQSAVMGQLIAGILLGPSVFGALLPQWQHLLFAPGTNQQVMLNAISQLGVLLLLLLTGMETDLSVVARSKRAAFTVSLTGIAIPFACGAAVGEFLPVQLLPDPSKRLITALFLGTALSISSVKIVALLVRELGFLRRTVGQVIVASAIIDDTIGWVIMSVIFGLAAHGSVDLSGVLHGVLGTAIFLALSFTIGRRIVLWLIRWANDRFISELPVITVILVITAVLALLTDAIGVHTVLGAFVAGILIGQSPILTRHIDEQLRGLIVALFMPVFFGMAGLSADLRALARPELLTLTGVLIAIASVGKFSGALLGGRWGGLSGAESLAVGCGMNARGSTEVIIATFGVSMGALSQNLFTAIVTMAIITTLLMPPSVRWAFARLPTTDAERTRLDREQADAKGFLPSIERLLVAVDSSATGALASHLGGLLSGTRGMPTTVLLFDALATPEESERQAQTTTFVLTGAADSGAEVSKGERKGAPAATDVDLRIVAPADTEAQVSAEARKGYGLVVIGRDPATEGTRFDPQITTTAAAFGGPVAIVAARGQHRNERVDVPLRILVPVNGTAVSRRGAELAIALAQGSRGHVAALHIGNPGPEHRWQRRFGEVLVPDSAGSAAIAEIVALGKSYGVEVQGIRRAGRDPVEAIKNEIRHGDFNLVAIGVSPRPGEHLFFGDVAAALVEQAPCSLVFLSSEPVTVPL